MYSPRTSHLYWSVPSLSELTRIISKVLLRLSRRVFEPKPISGPEDPNTSHLFIFSILRFSTILPQLEVELNHDSKIIFILLALAPAAQFAVWAAESNVKTFRLSKDKLYWNCVRYKIISYRMIFILTVLASAAQFACRAAYSNATIFRPSKIYIVLNFTTQ